MHRRNEQYRQDADFIKLYYTSIRDIYATAKELGMPVRYVRDVLLRLGLFVPARETRLKVLRMHQEGKTAQVIAQETGVSVDWVKRILMRHLRLDRLSDIEIIPHPPFPQTDSFQLRPEHRKRLEKLREAKVRKYNKQNEEKTARERDRRDRRNAKKRRKDSRDR